MTLVHPGELPSPRREASGRGVGGEARIAGNFLQHETVSSLPATPVVRPMLRTSADNALIAARPHVVPHSPKDADDTRQSRRPIVHRAASMATKGAEGPAVHADNPKPPIVQPKNVRTTEAAAQSLPHPAIIAGLPSAISSENRSVDGAAAMAKSSPSAAPSAAVGPVETAAAEPSATVPAIDIDALTEKVQRKIFRHLASEWERKGSWR